MITRYFDSNHNPLPSESTGPYSIECLTDQEWADSGCPTNIVWEGDVPRFKTDAEKEAEATAADANRKAAQVLLENELSSINSTYSLSLTSSMTMAEAIAIIAASSMTATQAREEIPYLKTLYDAVISLGGIK